MLLPMVELIQQLAHRGVHQIDEGLRPEAYPEDKEQERRQDRLSPECSRSVRYDWSGLAVPPQTIFCSIRSM
jgi:hypothetical protein